jgi:integrase
MVQKLQRLTALAVSRESSPGLYADGGGLYLCVGRNGAKRWAFRFTLNGTAHEMGFGGLNKVSLADARKKASDARLLLSEGRNPLVHKQEKATERATAEKQRLMTFDQCAEAYISAHEIAWKNEKHRQQWRNTLATYVSPVFGELPVGDVDTDRVLKVIEPIWSKKTETAGRVRGRIEVILDWARVRGYRVGENPARWRGHLSHLLPSRNKVRAVKHHAALSYTEISSFLEALRATEGAAAFALEFLILTAARTSEVIYASWSEVDLKKQTWIVPAERMKTHREHRVPLSAAAAAVLGRAKDLKGDYIFPGRAPDSPLSNMALLMLLGRMNCGDITAHGFRSTFRDWAAEQTSFSNEVVEMALAHAIESKTEAAYRRSDLFEKRRSLMAAWAEFCAIRSSARTTKGLSAADF